MPSQTTPGSNDTLPALRRNWGWLLAFGILMTVLGVLGFGMLVTLTIVTAIWFAAFLIVGGGAQLVDAFREREWSGRLLHGAIGLLYLAAGVLVVLDPLLASVTLTLMIAAALVAIGVIRIIAAFQMRTAPRWWLVLLAGLVSLALGIMIFASWPASGLFVLGLFFATELVMQGISCIVLALAVRSAPERDRVLGAPPSSANVTPPTA